MGAIATFGAAAVLVATLAACGDSSGSDGARSITVYSGRAEKLVAPIFERFTKQTGIRVTARYGDSGELGAQIITEGAAGRADVFFSQDAGALGAVSDAGLLERLPTSATDRVPARFRATDDTWVGTSARSRVLVYDPAQIADPPTSIDALLTPEFAGRIGFAPTNASWQSFVTALRVLRGEDGARVWLEDFAALDPKPYENNKAILNAVNAGEIPLGLINHYYLFEKIANEGADKVTAKLQFMSGGDPGGLVNVAGIGILERSEHRADAEKLLAFLLSDEGQRYFADETFEYPVVESVPAAADVPALDSLAAPTIDLADLRSLKQTQELLADVGLLTK